MTRTFVAGADGIEIEDYPSTAFGPQIDAQAWSEGDSSSEVAPPTDRASWWKVAAFAAAFLALAGLIVAGIIGATRPQAAASGWPPGYTNPPTPTMTPVPETTEIVNAPIAPSELPAVADAQMITPDGQFLQEVRSTAHWQFNDPDRVIVNAHGWCARMRATGESPGYVATLLTIKWSGIPGQPPTLADWDLITRAAARAYCPEVM